MLCLMSLESVVPTDHPLRGIKSLAEAGLRQLSPVFDAMYAQMGRPSVPPERLLKGLLLIALYSIRSERQFCEQLNTTCCSAGFSTWTCWSKLSMPARLAAIGNDCFSTK